MRKIAAQYLVPLNSFSPIPKGVLTLDDDGTIIEIGQLTHETPSTEFYNGIIVPGFVNSHCHIELSHLQDKFERNSGMAGFIRQINRLREVADKEARLKSIQYQMEQLYSSGVSAMADISNCNESFEAKSKSKLYTRTFLEVFGTEEKDVPKIEEGVISLTQQAQSFGIDAAPTPHSCYTMSKKLLQHITKIALDYNWLSYHNQESWEEEQLLINGTGPLADEYNNRGLSTPPVTGESALLYFLDIVKSVGISDTAKVLLVHNTFTNKESIQKAKDIIKELYWAICPLSNLFIHQALPPLQLMRREGLNITIGTDSLSSNHTLSIVEEIKTIQNFFPDIPLIEILEWSCYNGAKFLNKEDVLGSFEVGKRPGVVLIDNIDYSNFKLTDLSRSTRLI